MTKFRNKYRIETTRLKNWNYGSNALYFITICTKNRECFFGKIIEMQNVETQNFASLHFASPHFAPRHKYTMQLSEIGKMAEKCWYEIPDHFPFVKLDAFVVMPNHIHGIIEIAKPVVDANVETQNFASLHWHQHWHQQWNQQNPPSPQNKFGPQSKNLASIVRGYKIGVTKFAKKITRNWAWQPRYYDHIIRNHTSYQNIRNYIVNNPDNWGGDNFYKIKNR